MTKIKLIIINHKPYQTRKSVNKNQIQKLNKNLENMKKRKKLINNSF